MPSLMPKHRKRGNEDHSGGDQALRKATLSVRNGNLRDCGMWIRHRCCRKCIKVVRNAFEEKLDLLGTISLYNLQNIMRTLRGHWPSTKLSREEKKQT
ncbi:hypothetical protein ACFX2I_030950 [Malus domestica]